MRLAASRFLSLFFVCSSAANIRGLAPNPSDRRHSHEWRQRVLRKPRPFNLVSIEKLHSAR